MKLKKHLSFTSLRKALSVCFNKIPDFGSKRHLWETIRSYLRTFIFSSWEYLLNFTLNPENYISGQLPGPR